MEFSFYYPPESPWNDNRTEIFGSIEPDSDPLDDLPLPGQTPVWDEFLTGKTWSSDVWGSISEGLSREDKVVEIWGTVDAVSYYVLILIDKFDREARRRVYELQSKILDRYETVLSLDFNVLALEGRDSSKIVTGLKCHFRR